FSPTGVAMTDYEITGYLMQARSTTTGHLVTWRTALPDFTALYWPGPGSPEFVACTVLAPSTGDLPVSVAPPVFAGISPSGGSELGGTFITITGTGFVDGLTVTIGGVQAHGNNSGPPSPPIVNGAGTEITCYSPAGTGQVDVYIENPDAQNVNASNAFGYFFQVDFAALADGGISSAAFATATGLTSFTRGSTSTCQVSSSALVAGIANDRACIGSVDGVKRGLWVVHNTKNLWGGSGDNSPRNLTGTDWQSGTGAMTGTYAAGPDGIAPGVGCSRANLASGQYSAYVSGAGSGVATWSSWQRSKDASVNGDMQMGWISGTPGDGVQRIRAASDTWARLVLSSTARTYFAPADGRDYSASGGQTPRARDVLVDYVMLNQGEFATPAIPVGGAYRKSDKARGAIPTMGNRMRFYARFYPMLASSMSVAEHGTSTNGLSSALYLFSASEGGSPDLYAYIDATTKKLVVRVGGNQVGGAASNSQTSTNAMTFAMWDEVEILIEVGNAVASRAKWRVNGGSWNDFVLATFALDATPSQDCAIFYDDLGSDTGIQGQFPCVLAEIRAYTTEITEADL
ncbi:MAG: IPT/TIG domain-containing protein, partial [Gemmatimonadota bacterium]|nr:IPT/TIG domain-containing protein [Gemmatimonadota bacterium]